MNKRAIPTARGTSLSEIASSNVDAYHGFRSQNDALLYGGGEVAVLWTNCDAEASVLQLHATSNARVVSPLCR